MNWETPSPLSSDSSRRDREELHTQTGTPARCGGAADFAQNVFAGILGEVQVQQDQVWVGRIRISSLPADESEGFGPVQQVDQFEREILLLQRPIEKEDIRVVVINHKDSGGEEIDACFKLTPGGQPSPAVFIISYSTMPPFAVTPVLPLRSIAWAPARRSRKGNRSPASARSRLTERVPLHCPAPQS